MQTGTNVQVFFTNHILGSNIMKKYGRFPCSKVIKTVYADLCIKEHIVAQLSENLVTRTAQAHIERLVLFCSGYRTSRIIFVVPDPDLRKPRCFYVMGTVVVQVYFKAVFKTVIAL